MADYIGCRYFEYLFSTTIPRDYRAIEIDSDDAIIR
jgi:hypothetical protein